MKQISFGTVVFLGLLFGLVVTVWIASAQAAWLPYTDEETELSLRNVESNSRRSVYNRYNRFGK